MRKLSTLTGVCSLILCVHVTIAWSQPDVKFERERQAHILELVRDDVKRNYFDPTLKGIDIEAKYKASKEKIESAPNVGMMSAIIAAFLLDFDDSHLFFIPPGRTTRVSYGFQFRMVGDKCFVTSVREDSDAFKAGLRQGDQLLSIEGYEPNRDVAWKMQYAYYTLRPKTGLSLEVLKPDGKNAKIDARAKITHLKQVVDLTGQDINDYDRDSEDAYLRETRQYIYDKDPNVFVWKMPGFSLDPGKAESIIEKAHKYPALVFDLRGNGGGRIDMLVRLLGNLFKDDVKVADEKRRKEIKPVVAKGRGASAYQGKVVVLIDSGSASASEVFSRVIQLEKRGAIFGDRSAGAVMESMDFDHEIGQDSVIGFATSITIADLIMKDGKSLEKIGVTPDTLVVPTGSDLANRRDPVLAAALASVGVTISAEDAGKMFPPEKISQE